MSLVLCCNLIFIKLVRKLKRTAVSLIPGDASAVRKGLASLAGLRKTWNGTLLRHRATNIALTA